MYRDTPVMWCPYIYVDNDAALARGWTQGFPKKMGSIFQTRTFAAASRAAAPIVPGGRFGASLSAHGQRLAEACITLRKPVENGLSLLSRPTVLLRYFPRLAAGYQDKPAVNELAMSVTDNLTVADAWVGEGELNIPDAQGEELHALAPSRIESGFRYSLSYSVTDLRILEDHTSKYPEHFRRCGEACSPRFVGRASSDPPSQGGPRRGSVRGRRKIVGTASEYRVEVREKTMHYE